MPPSCLRFGVFFLVAGLLALSASAAELTGILRAADTNKKLAAAYLGLMKSGFAPEEQGFTGLDGRFSLKRSIESAFLIVRPNPIGSPEGMNVFNYAPRIYALPAPEETPDLELVAPPVITLVLQAYSPEGALMRWEDFERLGKHAGQFMYATNLADEAIPATCWDVHGDLTGAIGGTREEGLPSLLIAPQQAASVSILFWPVKGYGKLLLRADNAGQGFQGEEAGDAIIIRLNLELARTALADLIRRTESAPQFSYVETEQLIRDLAVATAEKDPVKQAELANDILSKALLIRDMFEMTRARAAIPEVRMGGLRIQLENFVGIDPAQCRVRIKQRRHDFLFGVFEGSPYNAAAFEGARKAGFDYATVLLAWNWTRNPKLKRNEINQVFGIDKLLELDYRVKAHGVLWMQDYGILPESVRRLEAGAIPESALAHQEELLNIFGEKVAIWEAINEPANTNVVGLSRAGMRGLMAEAGQAIQGIGKPSLVNSPHEFAYGSQFLVHTIDGQPQNSFAQSYSSYLREAEAAGALAAIDIIGLQFYPGFHLNSDFGEQQGPAYTPAHLLDTLRRYKVFGKSLHITEISIPSGMPEGSGAGYWREPWSEGTQADYLEGVYTMAFAEPQVHSITWWDILDTKSSVIHGGLFHADGSPKPALARVEQLMARWTSEETKALDAQGAAAFRAFAGAYELELTLADGRSCQQSFQLLEGWEKELLLDVATLEFTPAAEPPEGDSNTKE